MYIFLQKLLDRFDYDDEPEDTMATEGNIHSQWVSENVLVLLHMCVVLAIITDFYNWLNSDLQDPDSIWFNSVLTQSEIL